MMTVDYFNSIWSVKNKVFLTFALSFVGINTAPGSAEEMSQDPLPTCFSDIPGEMAERDFKINYNWGREGGASTEANFVFPAEYLLSNVFYIVPGEGEQEYVETMLVSLRISNGMPYPRSEQMLVRVEDEVGVTMLLENDAWVSLEGKLTGDLIYARLPVFGAAKFYEINITGSSIEGLDDIEYIYQGELEDRNKGDIGRDFFVSRDDNLNISSRILCSKKSHYPNPMCDHDFRYAGIAVNLSYNRKYLNNWKHIEDVARRFLECSDPEYFDSLRG